MLLSKSHVLIVYRSYSTDFFDTHHLVVVSLVNILLWRHIPDINLSDWRVIHNNSSFG